MLFISVLNPVFVEILALVARTYAPLIAGSVVVGCVAFLLKEVNVL